MHSKNAKNFATTVGPILSRHPRDFENWPLNRGWPFNRWPFNRGSTVLAADICQSTNDLLLIVKQESSILYLVSMAPFPGLVEAALGPAGNLTADAQTFFSLSLTELGALRQKQDLL